MYTSKFKMYYSCFFPAGGPQVIQNQNAPGQETEAESANPPVGANEDRKHHQVSV